MEHKNNKETPTQDVFAQDVLGQQKLKYWILAGGALIITTGLYFTNRETQDSMPQQAQKETQPLPVVPTHDSFAIH